MLPRGWAWQDCISLCVSIRPGELRGISALGWDPLARALRGCCSLHGTVIRGASSLPLDLPPPHFSHLPKWHQLFYPIRRSQDNLSISYNKQASHGCVCFCSWQNNNSPLLLVPLNGMPWIPVIWSLFPILASWDVECAGVGCRNSCSKSGGLGFCSLFGWLFRWDFCSL